MYVLGRAGVMEATISRTVDASNDVHSGLIVYKSLMKAALLSRTQLMPARYTADLAKELKGRGDSDFIGQTSHDDSAQTTSEDGGVPRHQHAYALWRQGCGLLDICIRMRDQASPESETVVMCVCNSSSCKAGFVNLRNYSSYILRALVEDSTLPFSAETLISLVRLDSASWNYHRDTIERWAQEGRGLDRP